MTDDEKLAADEAFHKGLATTKLRADVERAINCASAENGSNTPDFILAEFLLDCLAAYDRAVTAREKWYGRGPMAVKEPDINCPPMNKSTLIGKTPIGEMVGPE